MRCTNCTTELLGNPAVCPVCGTPTSRRKAPRSPTAGPRQPAPPSEPPAFFNAADLVDPDLLGEPPQAPAYPQLNAADLIDPELLDEPATSPAPEEGGFLNAADLFDPDLFDQSEPALAPEPPAGQLNAADLFDPDVLDMPWQEAAQPPNASPGSLVLPPRMTPSQLRDDDDDQADMGWRGAGAPAAPGWSRVPSGTWQPPDPAHPSPVAPLLSLQANPPPEAPPRRSSAPIAAGPAEWPPNFASELEAPAHGMETGRGWSVVPHAFQASGQGAILAPPRPARPRQAPPVARPVTGRGLLGAFSKTLALVLVLGIVGFAILIAYARLQQLQASQKRFTATQTTALPTITVPPGFMSYQNAQIGVSLHYPAKWQNAASQTIPDAQYTAQRFSASPSIWLEVGVSPPFGSLSPDQINTRIINALGGLPNVTGVETNVPDPPTTHLAGQVWTAEDASFTLQDGTVLQVTTLALVYHGRGYVIFYECQQSELALFSRQFFDPMLLSFRLLNG